MCQLVEKIKKYLDRLDTKILIIGQYHQMLDQVLKAFDIAFDYDLSINKDNQILFIIKINVLNGCKSIFVKEKHYLALIYGDAFISFAISLDILLSSYTFKVYSNRPQYMQ